MNKKALDASIDDFNFIDIDEENSAIDATLSSTEKERDEVKEIINLSSKETFRVQTWRLLVSVALLLTALAVTTTTFFLLQRAEQMNFELAYEQFSRTVAEAAIAEQRDLRQSLRSLSHAITAYAESSNVGWPYFHMPKFETLGHDFKALSRAELVGINNIVRLKERDSYIHYVNKHYVDWVQESHLLAYGNLDLLNNDTSKYNPFISRKGPDGFIPDEDRERYFVRTTMSPPARAYGPIVNWNTGGNASRARIGWANELAVEFRNETMTSMVRPFRGLPADEHKDLHTDDSVDHPHSFVYYPIHNRISHDSEVVATITAVIAWDAALRKLLPDDVRGIWCVIRNSCNQTFTYEIDGQDAIYLGYGDLHDKRYDNIKEDVDLSLHAHPNFTTTPGHCVYNMSIYPSKLFENTYRSTMPQIHAIVVGCAFVVVFMMFCLYDFYVRRRNDKLVTRAAQTNAIVTSIFPGDLPSRMIAEKNITTKNHQSLKKFLSNGSGDEVDNKDFESKPLADLFLETTVLFADIVGFTAWSSVREPTQVFRLLESVYSAFDRIARSRRVFKVETVGDCYVAVTGLPQPRYDHATTMIRYARDITKAMHAVTKKLEIVLGPDTGDLSIRVGIHSGPVTGGVLRGERSRFQLFGDTMNTAARIESTSSAGRIQISLETAKLVIKAGKEDWIRKRKDKVTAKGKGEIETYWVTFDSAPNESSCSEQRSLEADDLLDWNEQIANRPREGLATDDRNSRLIDWNVEMLIRLLRQIVARRNALVKYGDPRAKKCNTSSLDKIGATRMPLEEVKEIITLPKFNSRAARNQQDPENVVLSSAVISQLQDYVTCIANMYNHNPFHNFAHASHVVMSVTKLMSRIVAPVDIGLEDENEDVSMTAQTEFAATLHDHTYGITSDPLTQFACAFSALIHDVDHSGVPNFQLIHENEKLAGRYKSRSVAEQNSFDLSWDLLMKEQYADLRVAICSSKSELAHFRQLVINSVMATDLGDKELKALRNARWDKAFTSDSKGIRSKSMGQAMRLGGTDNSARDDANRKATIVIEHLIQASDVSHTMQHWHIYRKWNECLFAETYNAFLAGRCETDPRESWYNGEIGFFDFYVIPLAKKLKECGVFGISSDEYLSYAMTNRDEWELKGKSVVAAMVETMEHDKTKMTGEFKDES